MAEQGTASASEIRLRTDALHWREVEGQVVAIHTGSREYLAVNRSGTALWPALVAGTSAEELEHLLAERYALDAEVAARDVAALLADLRERDLLQP